MVRRNMSIEPCCVRLSASGTEAQVAGSRGQTVSATALETLELKMKKVSCITEQSVNFKHRRTG